MKKTIMILTASLGLAAAPGAWAAVIFDTTVSATSGSAYTCDGSEIAESFRTGSTGSQLSEVMLRMAGGTYPGNDGFLVRLYDSAGVGGNPGTSLLTLSGSANPFTAGNYTYTGSYALAANTDYWIVLAVFGEGYYNSLTVTSGPTVGTSPHGHGEYYDNSWLTYPTSNLSMQISGLSAVPEPSEWAAISFGVLGVVWVAKRRFMPARA